jgi:hypothetical protein
MRAEGATDRSAGLPSSRQSTSSTLVLALKQHIPPPKRDTVPEAFPLFRLTLVKFVSVR